MTAEREIIDGLMGDAEAALARGGTDKVYKGILAIDPRNMMTPRQLGAIEVNGGESARAHTFQALSVTRHS